jgi:predicted DNA-binding transcriptional regulator AlpA
MLEERFLMKNCDVEVPNAMLIAAHLPARKQSLRETVAAISNVALTPRHVPGLAENEILKPADAAAYLKLSQSTLAKLRLYGTGPRYTKVGRAVRYRRADLDAWINARYAESTSDADYRLPKRLADRSSVH